MRPAFRRRVSYASCLVASALIVCSSGCGFATGGVVAATSSPGGGGNAPPASTGFTVLNPKQSPAEILLELTDADADSVEVEFVFQVGPSGDVQGMTKAGPNPVRLAASRTGVQHRLTWDFAAEPGISTAALTRDVRLTARVRGGSDKVAVLDLGNDAPTVTPEPVNGEVSGVVPLSFFVADSSADISAIQVEYQVAGEPPDVWHLARAAGLSASEPTTAFSIGNVEATVDGTRRLFFWDSAYAGVPGSTDFEPQLPGLERDVTFRFTASDSVVVGVPSTLGPVRVDNNAAPIVQINDGALSAGGDRRRTVSLPFAVIDQESDTVDVVFQWKAASDAQFQDLGTTDPEELKRLLKDDYYVRDKRICKAGFLEARGEGLMQDPTHMITSDLAGDACWILPHGIVGRPIEFLRRVGAAPTIVSDGWAINPLALPAAVLSLDSGVEALVLEDLGGSARLRQIDVHTGAVTRTIATGIAGSPTTMSWSRRRNSVLIATHTTSGALVHDIRLEDGAAIQLAAAVDASITNQPIRGLVAFADRVVLATAANKLLRVEWGANDVPRTAVLLDNRSEPWGVVLDPLDRQRVFLAERGAIPGGSSVGRIAAWDLRNRLPVAFLPLADAPERPSAIALDTETRQLLVVSEPLAGGRALRRYALGSAIGASSPVPLSANARGMSPADVGGWLVVDPTARSLTAQGGAIVRRTVAGYDVTTGVLTLDAAVAGIPAPAKWRIRVAQGKGVAATPTGRTETFVWDTTAVAGAGPVVVRAIAIDSELGTFTVGSSAVTMNLDDHSSHPVSANAIDLVADLDADGALDVKHAAQVSLQTAPRVFGTGPSVTATATISFDVDGDGRNDLIEAAAQVRVWLQTASGFATTPTTFAIAATDVLDLDGDGRFDLIKRTTPTDVRFQTGAGVFSAAQAIPTGFTFLLADVDADGRTDIVVRHPGPSFATVHRQSAEGSFPASASFDVDMGGPSYPPQGSGATVWPTYVEDVDADGQLDFIAGIASVGFGEPTRVRVLWQSAAGDFGSFHESNGATAGFFPLGEDIDSDGLLDIIGVTPGLQAVLRQVGPRVFFVSPSYGPAGSPTLDIDGDGASDRVEAGEVGFRRRRANFLGDAPTGMFGLTAAVGDFDGDTYADLVVGREVVTGTAFTASSVQVHRQRTGGLFDVESVLSGTVNNGDGGGPTSRVQIGGDVSGDGISDFVWQTFDAGSGLRTLWAGALSIGAIVPINEFGFYRDTGSSGPFGAGRLGPGSSGTFFYQHDGNSGSDVHWTARVALQGAKADHTNMFGPPLEVHCYGFGDFNNDLRQDVVVGMDTAGQIGLSVQGPDGMLGAVQPVTLSSAGVVTAIEAADLDDDGDDDIVFIQDGNLRALLVNGPSLSFVQNIALLNGVSSFRVVDIDHDGDFDIVAANGQVAVIEQIAPRRFATVVQAGSASGTICMADVDNDGMVDIVRLAGSAIHVVYGGR